MADRQLKVTLVGDSRQLERTLGRTETRLQRFGKNTAALSGGAALSGKGGLSSSAAVLRGGGLALGFGLAGQKALEFTQAASDLNEQITRSQQVFGSSAGEIERWSKSLAASFGTSQTAALSAAGTFGLLFTNTGQSAENAAELSKSLVQLAADMASFNNTTIEQALDAIRSGLTGEIEPLRKYGVFLSEARTKTQALADTGKTSATQLSTGEKVLARYKLLLQDTTKAQGDFARTSSGLANQQRILAAQTANLEVKLGKVLLPTMTLLVSTLNDATDGALAVADGLNKIAGIKIPVIDVPIRVLFEDSGIPGLAKDAFGFANPATRPFAIANAIKGLFDNPAQGSNTAAAEAFAKQFGLESLLPSAKTSKGKAGVPSFGDPGFKPRQTHFPTTELTLKLQEQELDARLSGSTKRLREILKAEANFITKALDDASLTGEQRNSLKSALLGITDEISAIDDQVKSRLQDTAGAVRDARKALTQKFADQADAIKSAVLDSFDRQTSKIETGRALEDAKKALAEARVLGGPETIRLAQRDLVDAQRAIERQRLERAAFKVTEGPRGPVNALAVGNVTININGAGDPDVVAQKVLAVLRKKGRQTAGTTTGRLPVRPGP